MKDVIALVQSMSMNEKRYFQTKVLGNKTQALFSRINKEKNLTEKDIENITRKYSSRLQNFLLNDILKSLRAFHDTLSSNRILDNLIHEIDILINKELYGIAEKKIKIAKEKAEANSKSYHLMQLIKLEKKILLDREVKNVNMVLQKNAQIQDRLHLLNEEHRLEFLLDECRLKTFVIPPQAFIKGLENITISKNASLGSHYFYSTIKSYYNLYRQKLNLSYSNHVDIQKLFDSRSLLVAETNTDNFNVYNYILFLHNFLNVLKSSGRYEEYFKVVGKLENFQLRNKRANNRNLISYSISLTDLYIRLNKMKEGYSYLKKIENSIAIIDSEPYRLELLKFNFCYICFILGRYKEASQWLVLYVQNPDPYYKVIHKAALFLYVIIQVELLKYEFAYENLNNVKKAINQKDNFTAFDKYIADFIFSFLEGDKKTQIKQHEGFSRLCTSKEYINNFKVNLNAYFNFSGWMESKLSGKNFRPTSYTKD